MPMESDLFFLQVVADGKVSVSGLALRLEPGARTGWISFT